MFHRIAFTPDRTHLIAAASSHLVLFSASSGQPLASTLDSPAGEAHAALVRTLTVCEREGKEWLVSTAEDKVLKVWELPELKLRSSRELAKRATAVAISPDGQRIVVSDKFGDIYDLPFDPLPTETSETVSPKKGKSKASASPSDLPIAGHVSLVTSLLLLPSLPTLPCPLLITADRDEHIRLSAYPKAYHIRSYLLGSKAFVGALAWVPKGGKEDGSEGGWLVSGGGEEVLRVWDVLSAKEVEKFDVGKLKEGCKVEAKKPAWFGKQDNRQAKGKAKGKAVEADPESAPMGSAEAIKEDVAATTIKRTCVNKIAVSPAGPSGDPRRLCVSSAGSSTVLFIDSSAFTSELGTSQYLDFAYPVLDVAWASFDRVLLALDVSKPQTASDANGAPIRVVSIASGIPDDVTATEPSVTAISAWLASHSLPPPPSDSLYADLALLSKDSDFRHPEEAGEEGVERPKKRSKPGQVGEDGFTPVGGGRTGEKFKKRVESTKHFAGPA